MRGIGTGTVRNYFPAYRVFIYGIEVTRLCTSVRTSWPASSPMQCTIELVNPERLMTLTAKDIVEINAVRARLTTLSSTNAPYSLGNQPGSFQELEGLYQLATTGSIGVLRFDDSYAPQFDCPSPVPPVTYDLARIKDLVLPKKLEKGKYFLGLKGPDGESLHPELFYKYPFYQGKWIWHFSDPVSVVFRDPVNPSVWYWTHRGTVTDVAEKETEDYQSILTVTSEGPLKALRNARIMNATGAILTPEITGMEEDEFFTLLTSVPYSNFLQRLTLRNILELMIFGSQSLIDDLSERVHKGITAAELEERFGVLLEGPKRTDRVTLNDVKYFQDQLRNLNSTGLKFKQWKGWQGVEVRIVGGPIDPVDKDTGEAVTLYEWQRLIDNRVRVTDIGTMLRQYVMVVQDGDATAQAKSVALANEKEKATGQEAVNAGKSIDDVITEICSDIDLYPINQRVRLLMPAHLGSRLKTHIVDQELSSNIASSAEFFDRLSILQQTLDRIEFVLYDSPRGDIIVEMPLYDFEPFHFSRDAKDPLDERDDMAYWQLAANYIVDKVSGLFEEQPSGDSDYVDLEKMRSETDQLYERDFAVYKFEQISADIASSEQDVKTAFVARPRILEAQADDASRTGKKGEVAVLPNLIPLYGLRVEQGDTYGAINTPEASRVFAHIMLNRTNADTVNMRIPALPNWAAWLNRPVLIESRSIVAATKSIAHTIAWQSDANTDLGLWHAKFWDGRVVEEDGVTRLLFVPFGGVNARPFNYAYLLGIRDREKALGARGISTSDALLSEHIRSGRR